jgi:hypothetical protein
VVCLSVISKPHSDCRAMGEEGERKLPYPSNGVTIVKLGLPACVPY